MNFNELKKNLKKDFSKFEKIKIAVIGDNSTQFLTQAIKGYGYVKKLNIDIFEANYNQINEQIIYSNSEIYLFNPKYILLYISSEKLYEDFCNTPLEQRSSFADITLNRIKNYWEVISSNLNCCILEYNFVEIDDLVFGNFSNKINISFIYQIRKLNFLLMDISNKYTNVYILDLSAIQNIYGRNITYNEKYYYSSKMTLSINIIPYAAKQYVDVIIALIGKIKKCIITDLDNTLWGGVIGDDGINKIEIGELGTGMAFSDFQKWLKELKKRGIILAVCSKNNEEIAKEPFEKHSEMVLHLNDFSIFIANWEDKVKNIRYIQSILNIGMDSIVFIDDSPFEREMVKKFIPEITVPELPEDPSLYLNYLKSLNLFETVSYSKEDLERTELYKTELKRNEMKNEYTSIDDYLINLNMLSVVKSFDDFSYPRIAQLTQRSNQFNLRTVRYTESEIKEIALSDKYITLYFTISDMFGEHGIIAVVILEIVSENTLFIDTWLMSCRVLKRGMEEFTINKIISIAKEKGYKKVIGEYIKTSKNLMVSNIYSQLGFKEKKDNIFEVSIENFIPNKTYISEK